MIITSVKLYYERQTVPEIVPAVQGDTGRNILFKISDYEIPENAAAYFYVQKPSGQAVYNGAEITSSSEVLVSLTAQCLAEAGDNHCWLRFTLDDEIITSFECLLQVKPFGGEEAAESTTEMSIFDEAIEQARERISNAIDKTLTQQNMAAEAKAVGDAIKDAFATIVAAEYDEDKDYVKGDCVTHDGKFWLCTSRPLIPGWNTYFWREITVDELIALKVTELHENLFDTSLESATKAVPASFIGTLLEGIVPKHKTTEIYTRGDVVRHQDKIYACDIHEMQSISGEFYQADWIETSIMAQLAQMNISFSDPNGDGHIIVTKG